MSIYGCNIGLELQQRAVEYNSIFKKFNHIRSNLFDKMPVIEYKPPNVDVSQISTNQDTEKADEVDEVTLKLKFYSLKVLY